MKSKVTFHVDHVKERSVLRSAFFTPPFKIINVTEDRTGPWLHLMLMSTSPGILDADEILVHICLSSYSHLRLLTQAHQRIFEMQTGAMQRIEVQLAEHARLIYLPHPTVPQQRSIFSAENVFRLHATAQLLYGEVITCGRKHSGESFLFTKYQSLTKIYIEDKLVIREMQLIQPAIANFDGIGMLEGYTHQASLVIIKPAPFEKDVIHSILRTEHNVQSGVTAISPVATIVRILGHGSEQLFDCLQKIAAAVCTHKPQLIG